MQQDNTTKRQSMPMSARKGRPYKAWHDGLSEADCVDCHKILPIDEFSISTGYIKGGPRTYRKKYCRKCADQRSKKYERKRNTRRGWKVDPVCEDCGVAVPNCQFKYCPKCKIKARNARRSKDNFYRTARSRGWKRIAISQRGGKCERCEFSTDVLAVYDFHHIDPTTKIQMISDIKTWEEYWAEVQKCELLCSNCHRIEEWNLRYKPKVVVSNNLNNMPLFTDLQ